MYIAKTSQSTFFKTSRLVNKDIPRFLQQYLRELIFDHGFMLISLKLLIGGFEQVVMWL